MAVERASIWLFDESRSRIICANLFENGANQHSSAQKLARADYPNYFAALEEERSIAAQDAPNDPVTREFAESYLAPLGITSMLDAPIMTGGRCVGVVCLEHIGPMRTWTQEEESFAASLGDFVALTMEAEQRREVEERLRIREQELRLALKAASMGTWVWHLASDEIIWGDEVGPLFDRPAGFSPAGSAEYLDLVHPEDRDRVEASFQAVIAQPSLPHYMRHRVRTTDGSTRWVETKGQLEGMPSPDKQARFLGTVTDCTEMRELEVQLIQAQKMDGIGQLAGGIAHDFNNLLTAVSGFSHILLADATLSEDQQNSVRFISDASDRAAALTGQLLAFARRQPLEVTAVDVPALIEGVSSLLQRLIGERIALVTQVGEPAVAYVDSGQIEQVLINLGINARDAMPSGGELRITTDSVEYDGREHDRALAAGRYVSIAVSDSGEGIAPEILPQIFEPFFTTKPVGQGTGLGLSTCYGIVKQLGGEIFVESQLGSGTTFTVMLPEVVDVEPRSTNSNAPETKAGGGETILVVEDEELVRRLTVSVLTRAGYHVLIAEEGEQAIKVARSTDQPIDLVVADVVLPGRAGDEIVEDLRRIHPEIAVLFVSGYTPDSAGSEKVRKADFLQKPFRPAELTNLVRDLLDRKTFRRKDLR